MKRKILLIGLTVALALVLLVPTAAFAAKPVAFLASGTISSISPGDVQPAGNSGRWIVHERDLYGTISGDINGDYVLNYRATVDENQEGNLAGKLTVQGQDVYNLSINGKSQPMEFVWFEPFNTYLPRLSINGKWAFIKGEQGQGTFEAWFVFIPYIDEQGNVHVGQIVSSALEMTGKWQP